MDYNLQFTLASLIGCRISRGGPIIIEKKCCRVLNKHEGDFLRKEATEKSLANIFVSFEAIVGQSFKVGGVRRIL